MIQELDLLLQRANDAIAAASTPSDLDAVRVHYLARKGELSLWMERLKEAPPSDKPALGRKLNEVKVALQTAWDAKKETLELQVAAQSLDVTLPGRQPARGAQHPVTQTTHKIISLFRRLGFALADGPDIETEWHNFDALNTPPDHPARNEADTFYLNTPRDEHYGRFLLRTQTSPIQIRAMQSTPPPLRIICPGRCYRRDEIDATHGSSFHQVEVLAVDEGITLAHLKGTLESFFRDLLGPETRVRFRPHFFPFTEPSYEVDFSTPLLAARGREWVEICGCGMVDPAVLTAVGIDPERYTGFAAGMGVERIAMVLHQIPDLRLFEQNDLRFLSQFR
jgi:phenylalanyl-tRNA synthetase alpha chain